MVEAVSSVMSILPFAVCCTRRGAGLSLYEENLTTQETYFLAFLDGAGLESPFREGRIGAVREIFESVLG